MGTFFVFGCSDNGVTHLHASLVGTKLFLHETAHNRVRIKTPHNFWKETFLLSVQIYFMVL